MITQPCMEKKMSSKCTKGLVVSNQVEYTHSSAHVYLKVYVKVCLNSIWSAVVLQLSFTLVGRRGLINFASNGGLQSVNAHIQSAKIW